MKTKQLITAFVWSIAVALLASALTFGITLTAYGHRDVPFIVVPALLLVVWFVAFLTVLADSEGK